ncbi:MAG: DUF2971 domain-containing protein [Rickettsiales bacterium]
MTIQKLFTEDELESLNIHKNNFNDVILKNLHREPTSTNSQMRAMITLIQQCYRNNPDAADLVEETLKKDAISNIYNIERIRETSQQTVNMINKSLQEFRILCVSKNNDTNRMWEEYAEKGQGIAIRIAPSQDASKDSKFKLFKEVKYKEVRPALFSNTLSFIEDSLFANEEDKILKAMDNIIYTKTKEWEYEGEYRLATPVYPCENWETMTFHPEEISELYLGANISDTSRVKFITLAKSINQNILVFQTNSNSDGRLSFSRV